MCGIVGIFNHNRAFEQAKAALAILKNRGKDGFGLANAKKIEFKKDLSQFAKTSSKNILGQALHSVVGKVLQPLKDLKLKGGGILTANCEIYNWKELCQKHGLKARNDAELLLRLFDKYNLSELSAEKLTALLDELDGVFAFAYWKGSRVIIARDILGVKPLWFANNNGNDNNFAFASEKKALEAIGYAQAEELNPRLILKYELEEKQLKSIPRSFLDYLPEHKDNYQKIKQQTAELLDQAISKRIPEKKFGLLFSGGIDSTYLAKYFKDQGYNFTCYTAAFDTKDVEASDLLSAQKVAQKLGLKLKIRKIKLEEIPSCLQKIVPLIEDSNVVKVTVALTFYLACELAKKDGCKVIFSGLGSEEIFAGYERHKLSANINQECLSGLRKMYERDLYRDDVITMDNSLELRLPYLDINLVKYALKIPEKYKISEDTAKIILREIALDKGIPGEFCFRKKTAAQYGSRVDYALDKLVRKSSFPSKSAYLRSFYPQPNLKLGVLFSSGKDSLSAALIMQRQNYELACLIHLRSENSDSYMFQSAGSEMVRLQAKAMGLPLIVQKTKGLKEKELNELEAAIRTAKKKYHIQGLVSGALFSTYQRDRIEKVCDKLGLKVFSPLWHKLQEKHLQEIIGSGFEVILISVSAEGLDKAWLGRKLDQKMLSDLVKIKQKIGLNVAGEGGEFESLVLDCPLFKKKIILEKSEIIEESRNSARLVIKKARLAGKR